MGAASIGSGKSPDTGRYPALRVLVRLAAVFLAGAAFFAAVFLTGSARFAAEVFAVDVFFADRRAGAAGLLAACRARSASSARSRMSSMS